MKDLIRDIIETYGLPFVKANPRISAGILAVLIISWSFGWFLVFQNFLEKKSLTQTITTLEESVNSLKEKNIELNQRLIPYITVALENYPGSEENALALLASRIAQIELDTLSISDYQEVSRWDISGTVNNPTGNSLVISAGGPLAGWTDGYITFNSDSGVLEDIKCDTDARAHYLEAINAAPLFPFTYYIMSECLKQGNDSQWTSYREKALQIVRRTIKIPNHHQDHDVLFFLLTSGQ